MIKVIDKSLCCGCGACAQACPRRCIRLCDDQEGFLYPWVDENLCVDCGKCEKVCLELHVNAPREPLKTYAAKNKNEEIRRESSSGGIFTLLAETAIDRGGVVFGARFDENWEVMHDYAETKEGLKSFRGSKYVQSRIGETYRQAEQFLKVGRMVMFTGTPCQIAGLKRFLQKEYSNLLTVDFVCHGVPSPKVWRMYLDEITACRQNRVKVVSPHPVPQKKEIENIEFRSKKTGWKKYSFVATLSDVMTGGEKNFVLLSSVFSENPFMQAFLSDLILRPSCYTCPVKSGKSGSDITIGDFWGIEEIMPDFDDDKGMSLVMLHTRKFEKWLSSVFNEWREVSYIVAKISNLSIETSVVKPLNRAFLFRQLRREGFLIAWRQTVSTAFFSRLRRLWYRKVF